MSVTIAGVADKSGFTHGAAVGSGGGLGVTPCITPVYAAIPVGLFAGGKYRVGRLSVSNLETSFAVPAQ